MQQQPRVRVVTAEIEQNGAFLITQRRAEAALPLLWEFPGGRVHEGETDQDALKRCLQDRLGVGAVVSHKVLEVAQEYPNYRLDMAVYRCGLTGEPTPVRVKDIAWVRPGEFDLYEFPKADQQTIELLLEDGRE